MIKKFSDFKVNDVINFERIFSSEDYCKFTDISFDFNPLHFESEYALNSKFYRPIIPVGLSQSPFSSVAGMYFPGDPSLILEQNVKARRPLLYDVPILYTAKISSIVVDSRVLFLKCFAIQYGKICLEVNMTVQCLLTEWECQPNNSL